MSSKYHVKKLKKKNDHLSILWKDDFESKFHFMWLRDNCPTAIHPTANMRVFNILTVSKNIFPKMYKIEKNKLNIDWSCLLYTSPSPRDRTRSRMPSSA